MSQLKMVFTQRVLLNAMDIISKKTLIDGVKYLYNSDYNKVEVNGSNHIIMSIAEIKPLLHALYKASNN